MPRLSDTLIQLPPRNTTKQFVSQTVLLGFSILSYASFQPVVSGSPDVCLHLSPFICLPVWLVVSCLPQDLSPSLGGGVQLSRCLSSFVSLHVSPTLPVWVVSGSLDGLASLVSQSGSPCFFFRFTTCLPLIVSDANGVQKIETAWHENMLLVISIDIDQKLPVSGASITTKMDRRCNGYGITVWGLQGCNMNWHAFAFAVLPAAFSI